MQQLDSTLLDMDPLIRRACTTRSTVPVFFEASIGANSPLEKKGETFDDELIDDSDFYSILLKDIISSGAGRGTLS